LTNSPIYQFSNLPIKLVVSEKTSVERTAFSV
jgi:hypothetical protein